MGREDVNRLGLSGTVEPKIVRRIYGSSDFIRGELVYCLWIEDENLTEAKKYPAVAQRIAAVKALRLASPDKSANQMADRAHQFREMRHADRKSTRLNSSH